VVDELVFTKTLVKILLYINIIQVDELEYLASSIKKERTKET
jgi:hypothetical protein